MPKSDVLGSIITVDEISCYWEHAWEFWHLLTWITQWEKGEWHLA